MYRSIGNDLHCYPIAPGMTVGGFGETHCPMVWQPYMRVAYAVRNLVIRALRRLEQYGNRKGMEVPGFQQKAKA